MADGGSSSWNKEFNIINDGNANSVNENGGPTFITNANHPDILRPER
ncbi:hypothetical protein [Streptomyces microflavus]|uniref:Uncharacterized protein n=1 Tax=Streptomyces microflavus TaxID=1919 RepID=A0A7H8MY73_STRMI|nr:hypothetical protein [Streptomyces microflavus]QKW47150.1 hypothetical protein HUT09_33985 [Streptomyces microflavus]